MTLGNFATGSKEYGTYKGLYDLYALDFVHIIMVWRYVWCEHLESATERMPQIGL